MKTGKTPYEIRSDLLHLAYQVTKGIKDAECAQEKLASGSLDSHCMISKAPTAEEIVTEATKLNAFVSQSNDG